jgi:hypothetical protein
VAQRYRLPPRGGTWATSRHRFQEHVGGENLRARNSRAVNPVNNILHFSLPEESQKLRRKWPNLLNGDGAARKLNKPRTELARENPLNFGHSPLLNKNATDVRKLVAHAFAPLGPLISETNLRPVWRINRLEVLEWLLDGRRFPVLFLWPLTGFIAVKQRCFCCRLG